MNAHRQQGCEGLIEIDSSSVDCKPTVVDVNMEYHAEFDDNRNIDNSLNADGQQQTSKHFVQKLEQSKDGIKTDSSAGAAALLIDNKSASQKENKSIETKQSNGRIECDNCVRSFTSRSNLIAHQRKAHPGKPIHGFSCEECGERFAYKKQLVAHRSTHSDKRLHPCEECHRIFSLKSNLIAHKRARHFDGGPFSCNQCDKRFAFKAQLISHRSMHPDKLERWECWLCHKA